MVSPGLGLSIANPTVLAQGNQFEALNHEANMEMGTNDGDVYEDLE